jgi:hypothetical protein
VTAADGGFSFVVDAPIQDSVCVRLFVRDSSANALEAPVGNVLRVKGTEFPWDTLDVPLTFTPTQR